MAEAKKEDHLDDVALDDLLGEQKDILAEALTEDPPEFDDELPAGDDGELEAIKAERDEFRDRFMRALADAENARKRSDRDRREAEQYGGSRLARDLRFGRVRPLMRSANGS